MVCSRSFMDAFLTRGAFAGSVIDVNAFRGSFVGEARFHGCIMFSNWPRREVARLLPPELELAGNNSALSDVHPVVFIFGEQTDGAVIFGGVTVPTGVHYHEFGMAIPFVKHVRGRYLHTHIVRMYASYFPAVWNGSTHYGFAKEMGKMSWQGPVFVLTTEEEALLFHAAVEREGEWSPGSACMLPSFEAMREAFALPIVGRKADGTLVCSYFGWAFSEASVRAADACASIDAPLVDGLTPRRCHDVPSGTFDVRGMTWRVTWPAKCEF